MIRNVLAVTIVGLLSLALYVIGPVSWFATESDETPASSCFNRTLVDICTSQFAPDLKTALRDYSDRHDSLIQVTYPEYLSWRQTGKVDNWDRHRYYQHYTQAGSSYGGDVFANFYPAAHFAFFPHNFTMNRFEQTLHPSNVCCPSFSLPVNRHCFLENGSRVYRLC
jgi:hypothetical protein